MLKFEKKVRRQKVNAWVCGRSIDGLVGSNPTWGGEVFCLSVVSVVCCQVEFSAIS